MVSHGAIYTHVGKRTKKKCECGGQRKYVRGNQKPICENCGLEAPTKIKVQYY